MGRKITMNGHNGQSVAEVFQEFIFAKTAEGVSDITIRNYHQHLHNISKYAPVLLSACEEGDQVALWLSNETRESCRGNVGWRLVTLDGMVLDEGSQICSVAAGESRPVVQLDYYGYSAIPKH